MLLHQYQYCDINRSCVNLYVFYGFPYKIYEKPSKSFVNLRIYFTGFHMFYMEKLRWILHVNRWVQCILQVFKQSPWKWKPRQILGKLKYSKRLHGFCLETRYILSKRMYSTNLETKLMKTLANPIQTYVWHMFSYAWYRNLGKSHVNLRKLLMKPLISKQSKNRYSMSLIIFAPFSAGFSVSLCVKLLKTVALTLIDYSIIT